MSVFTAEQAIADGVSVPDFVPVADLVAHFEPPWNAEQVRQAGVVKTPARAYEYADPNTLPACPPERWLLAAKRRRPRTEWHDVARYLAGHANYHTGRGARCSVVGMASAIEKHRVNCENHVIRMRNEGWLRVTGKAPKGVLIYALAIPETEPTQS